MTALLVGATCGGLADGGDGARAGGADWPALAGGPTRVSVVASGSAGPGAPELVTPVWVATEDEHGTPVAWTGQASPVVWNGRVFALGEVAGAATIVALDASTGDALWSAAVDTPSLDSWSSPVVDGANGTVLVASGAELVALNAATGAPVWTTALDFDVVNASPLVTTDRGPTDRAFVTDYDGFGTLGQLYCVNVDAFDAALNPHHPGEIVWRATIGGSSGATPAYDGLRVYVGTTGTLGLSPGTVRAYDAGATGTPGPVWTFTNVVTAGFFGGVSVENGAVYAASYAFFGGLDSANLVKLDAATGALAWSAACNRTSSIPAVTGDGRVVVSCGLDGFGSVPSVRVYEDLGASAALVWDSALATWDDSDSSGTIDAGEFERVGGWTHQPVVLDGDAGGGVLVVGEPPTGATLGAGLALRAVDLAAAPGGAGWTIVSTADGASDGGGSPAVAGGMVYSIGGSGLAAFALEPPVDADVDGDGDVDIDDLYAWEEGAGSLDVEGDGDVDAADRMALIAVLRAGEIEDMFGGRP